jgi:hypothetical protein
MRGTARVCEVDPKTVRQGLGDVMDQLQAFARYVLCDVHVRQVPLDEFYAVLRAVKDGELSEDEALQRLSRSPQGGWVAIEPVSQLLRALDVGQRPLAMAPSGVHQVVRVRAPGGVPLCLTDGFTAYTPALRTHDGPWGQPARQPAQGPPPQPRWLPRPARRSAPVVQTVRRRRLGRGTHRVVVGTLEAIQPVLAACGWQSNTAVVERINRTIRPHVAAMGRRVTTRCQDEEGVRQQRALSHVSDNVCLPHASLRAPLPQPVPTKGTGSATPWRPRTPAMAAGLTDHVWTWREVRRFRVPPWPQPAGVCASRGGGKWQQEGT